MPHQLPEAIETAIRHKLLTPLAEVLAGHRSPHDLDSIATSDIVYRLTLLPRQPHGQLTVRTITTQPALARGAIELAATLTDPSGKVHPLGVRIERRRSQALIVAVATDLWGRTP